MGRCYDTVVFIDKTNALNTKYQEEGELLEAATGGALGGEAGAGNKPMNLNKRLMKEYRQLMKHPSENVHAHPLEDNILEWHFVITGSQDPFTDGKYHGVLEFPASFPMAPPAIRMLTPSGRFETNTRICMSMSDYHPELWNPAWTVQTILIGLQSFMYEESNQIGGMKASMEQRRRMASSSLSFNMRNEIYVNLFCAEFGSRNPKKKSKMEEGGGGIVNDEEREEENVCRFCHNSGDLVCPCSCKGSSKYVHLSCLRQWQKTVLLSQSTHPKYQTQIDEVCNVCKAPFRYQGKSRRQAILEYTGQELSVRIAPGNLLITSRHSSEENEEAMRKRPAIAEDIAHWTEAVFLLVSGGGEEHVMALNLMRPVAQLKLNLKCGKLPGPRWKRELEPLVKASKGAITTVEHFVGGPMEMSRPMALIEIAPVQKEASGNGAKLSTLFTSHKEFKRRLVRSSPKTGQLFFFPDAVDAAVLAGKHFETCGLGSSIKVFWGYAAWGSTQLLAELARRSWGLSESTQWEERGGLKGLSEGNFCWDIVVDKMAIAKASEYSREQ